MQDVPPADLPPEPPSTVVQDVQTDAAEAPLAIEERDDGTVVIDLKPLAPKPVEEECIESDPNPLDNGIVVCGKATTDQKLTSEYGPVDEPDEFASAIPRAKFRISDDATGELNATNPTVGGFNAQGVEAKVRIDF